MTLKFLISRPGRKNKYNLNCQFIPRTDLPQRRREFWRTPPRIVAILAGALGLLLASIGVYEVVSYAVSGRIREIGLRMTRGADTREVMKMILSQAMRPVLIGAAIGIAGCAAVSRVLSSMLFGLSAHDPLAFIAIPVLLLSIAMLASYIPARRATK